MCRNTSVDPVFPRDDFLAGDRAPARIVTSAIGISSAVACLFIIATFIYVPRLRKATSRRILVYLSIADFIYSLSNSIGALVYLHPTACYVQAAVTVASGLSSVFWSTSLAIYVYLCIVKDNVVLGKRLMVVFHTLSWGVPVIIAILGLNFQVFGSTIFSATVGWCWIRDQPKVPRSWDCPDAKLFWMLISLKGWECASYVIIPLMYVRVKLAIRRTTAFESQPILSQRLTTAMSSIDKKMSILPVAYILLRVWGTVRAFLDYTGGNMRIAKWLYTILFYLQAIGDNAQGIINFLLFVVLTKAVREQLPDISPVCPSCKKCPGVKNQSLNQDGVELADSGEHGFYKRSSNSARAVLNSARETYRGKSFFWNESGDWPGSASGSSYSAISRNWLQESDNQVLSRSPYT